ncbi:hypothetical protein [Ottowia sp.]|uniref:hypothetical protein n=1 Tax=Ottowia sp. TaxID=1898956 RepID=UPI0025CD2924|nr:hypothetical protein [Ottowia sp.]MBK6616589.1 hypothetical protein [Ottowia sp.]
MAEGLKHIAELLAQAGDLPNEREGHMVISATGMIAHAARALREMAVPFDNPSSLDQEEFAERLSNSQPALHAYGLEQLGEHLGKLEVAFRTGDIKTIRSFFDLYVFD